MSDMVATFTSASLARTVTVLIDDLTDETMTALLLMGRQVRKLTVDKLALESDQHANTPWPWEEFVIRTCNVAHFARLPDPRGGRGKREIRFEYMHIRGDISVVRWQFIHTSRSMHCLAM